MADTIGVNGFMTRKQWFTRYEVLLGWVLTFSAVLGTWLVSGCRDRRDDTDARSALTVEQRCQVWLTDAWTQSRMGNVPKAAEFFECVLEEAAAEPSQRVQALFGLGNVYQFCSPAQPLRAEQYFQRIVTEYPSSDVAPWAQLRVGQLQDLQNPAGRERAQELFASILDEHGDEDVADEAALSLAATYFMETDPTIVQLGLITLEEHMQRRPDNALASSMLFRLSYWYMEVERDYDKGLQYGLLLGAAGMCNPKRQAMQYWGMGQVLSLRMGKDDEALMWYQRVVDEFPRDYLTYPASQKVRQLQQQSAGDKEGP